MFWKIFFWLASIGFALVLLFSSLEVKWTLVDWASFIAFALGLLSLYLYAYKKRLWSKEAWLGITISVITYWIIYSFYLDARFGAYPPKTFGDSLFTFLCTIPVFAVSVLYTARLSK